MDIFYDLQRFIWMFWMFFRNKEGAMKYIFRSHLKIFLLFGSIFRKVLQSEVYNEDFILNLKNFNTGGWLFYPFSPRDQNRFFYPGFIQSAFEKEFSRDSFQFQQHFFFTRKSSLVFNSSIQIVLWKLFIHNMNFLNFLIQNKIIASFQ